jgi:hypothetical protein
MTFLRKKGKAKKPFSFNVNQIKADENDFCWSKEENHSLDAMEKKFNACGKKDKIKSSRHCRRVNERERKTFFTCFITFSPLDNLKNLP